LARSPRNESKLVQLTENVIPDRQLSGTSIRKDDVTGCFFG
ncbi:MAG: hypothetical protein ACI9DC_001130, partial [Gammaproteobacteria bacterium]